MKILYIVGACLTKNTSANMSHNAYILGILENNCEVDIIMQTDSWGYTDSKLKKYENATYYEFDSISFSDRIRRKFTHANKPMPSSVNVQSPDSRTESRTVGIKEKLRGAAKSLFYTVFKPDKLYPLDLTWLKRALKFKSDACYDLVVSNSSPAASHKLADILLKSGNVKAKRWIQIWEDPWSHDLYGNYPDYVEREEHDLMRSADEVYYVSPLTAMYQKRFFPDCADKIKCIPLPYFEYSDDENDSKSTTDLSFGYFGDYYSVTRNLLPFYKALRETGFRGNIYGDTDLNLEKTDRITVSGRVTLDVLADVQNNTDVLVHLSNLKGGQIPGKIYHYSATTKPILFILDGTEEEQNELYNFFSQFDRYYFCENNENSIMYTIKKIIKEKDKKWEIVTAFSPKNVVKQLFDT